MDSSVAPLQGFTAGPYQDNDILWCHSRCISDYWLRTVVADMFKLQGVKQSTVNESRRNKERP